MISTSTHHAFSHPAGNLAALLRPPPKSSHEQLISQSQKWVAQTFYGTLLKQMRNSPFHSKMFDGGRGGQAFTSMLDQRLSDHMARSTGSKLVKSIVARIEAKAAYKKNLKMANKASPTIPARPSLRRQGPGISG